MKAHDIFHHMSPPLFEGIMDFFGSREKMALKMAIGALASARRFRVDFVLKKPKNDRLRWIQGELGRSTNAVIAENFMQSWLLGSQSALLVRFMDTLGIAHDERGEVKEMPDEVPAEQLGAGLEDLLANFPAENVAVYLHALIGMEIVGWASLKAALAGDVRLRLPQEPAVAPEAVAIVGVAGGGRD